MVEIHFSAAQAVPINPPWPRHFSVDEGIPLLMFKKWKRNFALSSAPGVLRRGAVDLTHSRNRKSPPSRATQVGEADTWCTSRSGCGHQFRQRDAASAIASVGDARAARGPGMETYN